MAEIQYTFERVEKKFLLTASQYEALLPLLEEYMEEDEYGEHTVCNIYYDTERYDLIRTSIEKPPYKEKFRLRSYGAADQESSIFAEIKKKSGGIVYKRRVAASPAQIRDFLGGGYLSHEDAQIQREIQWFLYIYHPKPAVFIAYERKAFTGKEDPGLRVTFDWNIRWRQERLDLCAGTEGEPVMPEERIVMEVKLANAAPLWLAGLLGRLKIYPAGFSKYGACYQQHLIKRFFSERKECTC